jgi:hypothetical protein
VPSLSNTIVTRSVVAPPPIQTAAVPTAGAAVPTVVINGSPMEDPGADPCCHRTQMVILLDF